MVRSLDPNQSMEKEVLKKHTLHEHFRPCIQYANTWKLSDKRKQRKKNKIKTKEKLDSLNGYVLKQRQSICLNWSP